MELPLGGDDMTLPCNGLFTVRTVVSLADKHGTGQLRLLAPTHALTSKKKPCVIKDNHLIDPIQKRVFTCEKSLQLSKIIELFSQNSHICGLLKVSPVV